MVVLLVSTEASYSWDQDGPEGAGALYPTAHVLGPVWSAGTQSVPPPKTGVKLS